VTRRTAVLAVAVFGAAALLSLKTGFDLLRRGDQFPSWFVPAFVAGLAVLIAYSGLVCCQIWRVRESAQPAAGTLGTAVWILLPLSFVCTSAVHQFYPFRLSVAAIWGGIDPVLRFNLGLTAFGFLAAAALAVLYRSDRRETALAGLLILDLLLLVPNDACANPFNTWWIAAVGASPLMFLPNLYASLFAVAALLGVRPRWNLAALAAACAGVLLLGLGHMTRLIW
jgi:hypothetical protein